MRKIKVTTRTSAEIGTLFDAVFKDVKPPSTAKPLTQADQLAPYQKAVMKQRRRGLTWKQIADGMADPRIAEKISERALKRQFAGSGRAAKPTVFPPSPPRLVLDPVTRKPTILPPPK